MADPQQPSVETTSESTPPIVDSSPRQSSFGIITIIALALTLIAALVVVGIAFGWTDPLVDAFRPKLVAGRGKVTYNGKPLTVGFVGTIPESSLAESALGPLGPNGEFEFTTNGAPGIPVGEHKVMVFARGQGFPSPSLIPERYASSATTPLRIDVSSDPAQNVFEFNLVGDVPGGGNGQAAGGGSRGGGGGPRGGGGRAGRGGRPERTQGEANQAADSAQNGTAEQDPDKVAPAVNPPTSESP